MRVWIHCSSLGEFEQARPLLESLKTAYPLYKLVLTFFSPSGYEVRNKYDQADYVFYLPMDGKGNAKTFLTLVDPRLAIFVKYEFWYFYLAQLQQTEVPAILICAAFRTDQIFFKSYGKIFRKMIGFFSFIFLQDEASLRLLNSIGRYENVKIGGDTRYDRVSAIAAGKSSIAEVEEFKSGCQLVIAGSTWPHDELILAKCFSQMPSNWKLVIAPHEIDEDHLNKIARTFGEDCVFFSKWKDQKRPISKNILIMDNMGMLSRLYAYGSIAYVGGGFQKGGIHNILEPAVFGLPVIFGPEYQKFVEAATLVALGLAFPVKNVDQARSLFSKFMGEESLRSDIQKALVDFMEQNRGATATILGEIDRHNWLITRSDETPSVNVSGD
jgi:3-deoxy-D-manno-octulosonic-acid transferase